MIPAHRQPSGLVLRELRYEPDARQRPHHHDLTSLTLVCGGSLEETVGRVHEEAASLSVVFKPAGTEHANRIGAAGATTLQLTLDSGLMPPGATSEDAWGWAHGGPAALRFLDLFRGWASGRDDDRDSEGKLFDLIAALAHGEPDPDGAPGWLGAVVEELEDTFAAPRSVRALAADADVHPVSLARAHRRHFGCSVSDRIRRRRVSHAAALLAGHEAPLTHVAFESGFADQSHLTRVFKAETGVTPAAYRTLLAD